MLAQYRVMCEIGNTFSEVVICRRFCPAGGQPFFRAFLRLPDHNPLKRLEAFFRVISSQRRRGAPHPTGPPASFYSARCKTPLAARSCTPLSRLRKQQLESFFTRESLASRGTPSLTKIMQRRTHPPLSFPSFVNILRLCFPPCPPQKFPVLFLVSFLSLFFVIFVPSTR